MKTQLACKIRIKDLKYFKSYSKRLIELNHKFFQKLTLFSLSLLVDGGDSVAANFLLAYFPPSLLPLGP